MQQVEPQRARTSNGHVRELFQRYPRNPILTAADWPYAANSVFNAAATRLPNGETLLLVRVEDRRGVSHLTTCRSANGVSDWRVNPHPTLPPEPEAYPEEIWGVEDPRITWLEDLGRYAVVYTAFSRLGPLVSLALTDDFVYYDRRGPIMPPEDKDAAFFPRKFDGRWALIHRPVPNIPGAKAHMWLSFTPDLKHYGDHQVLLEARDGAYWDAGKIGLSPPPIETPEGWLVVYHGVRQTVAGALYRMGAALLDLDDPSRVLRRSDEWLLSPEAEYERVGDVPGVIFPCGLVHLPETGELRLYYGAADTTVAMATASLADVLAYLRTCTSS
jgi:predicted GH43/DUF377 family glycosyl hydrolase